MNTPADVHPLKTAAERRHSCFRPSTSEPRTPSVGGFDAVEQPRRPVRALGVGAGAVLGLEDRVVEGQIVEVALHHDAGVRVGEAGAGSTQHAERSIEQDHRGRAVGVVRSGQDQGATACVQHRSRSVVDGPVGIGSVLAEGVAPQDPVYSPLPMTRS